MKSLISYLVLVTLFVCLSIKHASSIQCYTCDSTSDKKCKDNYFDFKTKCATGNKCSILQIGDSISRSCGSAKQGKSGSMDMPGLGKVAWSSCETDLCNGGSTKSLQMLTLIVSGMLSLHFYYKF